MLDSTGCGPWSSAAGTRAAAGGGSCCSGQSSANRRHRCGAGSAACTAAVDGGVPTTDASQGGNAASTKASELAVGSAIPPCTRGTRAVTAVTHTLAITQLKSKGASTRSAFNGWPRLSGMAEQQPATPERPVGSSKQQISTPNLSPAAARKELAALERNQRSLQEVSQTAIASNLAQISLLQQQLDEQRAGLAAQQKQSAPKPGGPSHSEQARVRLLEEELFELRRKRDGARDANNRSERKLRRLVDTE